MNLIGYFGSFVAEGLTADTDLVDLIYEQECLRFPELKLKRDEFRLVNFNLTAPNGTELILNDSEYCKVRINETRQLVIPVDFFELHNCKLLGDCASVNCRYLY